MKILSFGEILWDIFPTEKKIGGAPFNFAAHAARLGAESYMVSAVGSDENGFEALEIAKELGIKPKYITISRKYPTAVCRVSLSDGKPTYTLAQNTAYDHISDVLPTESFDAVYMGTLAMRSPESRRSFEKLLKYTKKKEVFFDLNLRGNFYTRELLCSDKPKSTAVSTVGAGDSFSAAFLVGLLEGRRASECLDRAVILSDYVVTQLGAVPDYDAKSLF